MTRDSRCASKMLKLEKTNIATTVDLFPIVQDEKALYDAAMRGDVSAVRRLIAAHVNVDCAPNKVYTI